MEGEELLEEFKLRYQEILNEINPNLPIIASIGKQSQGKSFFLGRLFKTDIINKHNQYVQQGTKILYHKAFNNFVLLDMEGIESNLGNSERDTLNFSLNFAISDIILLHISQETLENSEFKMKFGYIV